MNHYTNKLTGRTVLTDQGEYLYFAGTAYLGLDVHETFNAAIQEGIGQYGHHFGASRLGNLKLSVFEDFENAFTSKMGYEDGIVVSSGTLAAQLFVQAYGKNFACFYIKGTHPSLFQNQPHKLITADTDGALQINQEDGPAMVLFNALDPLFCEVIDFEWLMEIDPKKPLTVVVDASHAFGVQEKLLMQVNRFIKRFPNISLVLLGSLGKAYSMPAGIIMGDKSTMDQLRKSPLFGGSSPASPAYLYAFLKSATLIQTQYEKLLYNRQLFAEAPSIKPFFKTLNEFPVFVSQNQNLVTFLQQQKVLISSFRYPTPDAALLNRIVINASHSKQDILNLIQILNDLEKEKGEHSTFRILSS
ncbi:aminotransferase class I/II-fold pyridoxal phosphate-dependent enzyme [Limibacter armeniacum]|uniref:aminotransferase class I/II-fold pyridoxal phosphate-dependent enzyme n=1 Tax=Limibacter armeniacum TaxID=466084 RepID=UPI002FE5CD1F